MFNATKYHFMYCRYVNVKDECAVFICGVYGTHNIEVQLSMSRVNLLLSMFNSVLSFFVLYSLTMYTR